MELKQQHIVRTLVNYFICEIIIKKWLMYDNKYCYDLQTLMLSIKNQTSFLPTFPNIGTGGNLLIKTCDNESSKTYTLRQPKYYGPYLNIDLLSNTKLIIPEGFTLDSYDVCLNCFDNSNLYILGTVQNTAQKSKDTVENVIDDLRKYSYLSFYSKDNQNIIICPKATYAW